MRELTAIGIAMLWMGCGSIPEVTLYDVDLTPTVEEQVRNFPHRHVFMDSDNSTMFGVKNHPCKRVKFIQENSVEGKDHISIEWNQTDSCRYLGIGFPWANYAGKNLRLIEDVAALQFHLRLDSGSASKVPMFFSLVDYGGKQANTKINLLNVDGKRIDDTWRIVHIPLSSFHAALKGVNLENIKELRIEFQRQGFVHLDAIQIVPFHHEERKLTSRGSVCRSLPVALDENQLWWGVGGNPAVQWVDRGDGSSLSLNYNRDGLDREWNGFGVALNDWEVLDMSQVFSASALTFQLHGQWAPMTFGIYSAKGSPRSIQSVLGQEHCVQTADALWSCAMPIKNFNRHDELDWSAARELRVTMMNDIQTKMVEFRWEEYRGNPLKVQKWIERKQP